MLYKVDSKTKSDFWGQRGIHPIYRTKRLVYEFDQGEIQVELADHTHLHYSLKKDVEAEGVPIIVRERKSGEVFMSMPNKNGGQERIEIESALVYFETAPLEEDEMAVLFSYDKRYAGENMASVHEVVFKNTRELRTIAAHMFRCKEEICKLQPQNRHHKIDMVARHNVEALESYEEDRE